eukprot:CAMPEP_0201520568 /NCGR_PEP_ID=MMETSP0161_2-20130828/11875_1 /ASSEMBLY_ACC=CAM_ASM_000251 /TAXON_ID=180227 /ORGANISM="Neoparamoeba aestuarina, Strain SoJaBio B1-5/56/2" /LENGTH=155 /DNA_ID=CAMNT_0047918981 /DNA_START=28 /DNA_END=495 /DNA_ORIENTATION=+
MVKAVSTRKTTAFMAFCSEKREPFLKAGKAVSEVGKILGEQWNKLSAEEKKAYEGTAAELDRIKQEKIASGEYTVKEPKSSRVKKGGKKEKAKRAPTTSAYMQFCAEERQAIKDANPNLQVTDIMKELGAKWKEASPEVKAKYQKMADEWKAKHQ